MKPITSFEKIKAIFSRQVNVGALTELLSQDLRQGSLRDKMRWLENILQWLFQDNGRQLETRFRFFFQVLGKNPEWREKVQHILTDLLNECRFLDFFADVGYNVEHGLWGDIAKRLAEKVVPLVGKTDFQEIFLTVFKTQEEVFALRHLSDETLLKIAALFDNEDIKRAEERVQKESIEAVLFLATHIAHYGISSEIRDRLSINDKISEASFFQLAHTFHSGGSRDLLACIENCDKDIERVYANMEGSGVSVDMVNRLETILALLGRLRGILKLYKPKEKLEQIREVRSFVADVIDTEISGRSIWSYIERHFYLLSRKIVERNGFSGEHYIARNASELSALFKSAVGGGFIVVAMMIFKTWLIQADLAPIFLATGIWIIYSFGFLAMQFTDCTLATKIPSFTASRLAGLFKDMRRRNRNNIREEIHLTFKSQVVALLGNIVGLIPLALLVCFAFETVFGGYRLMSPEYSHHILEELNPVFSFAIFLGAVTGVQLWLSSVAGGWFENWIVFNRIPIAIENHERLRKVFGEESAKRFSEWVVTQSSGIATNVSLGFLFGFVPLVGELIGANWNGHHVTISTTAATFAVWNLEFNLSPSDWIFTVLGLLVTGFMNFGISFCLALFVAGNAQHMTFKRVLNLLKRSI